MSQPHLNRAARPALDRLEARDVPAVITVNSTSDAFNPSDVVVNLREAIESAINNADSGPDVTTNRVGAYGDDEIRFNFVGAGPFDIGIATAFTDISGGAGNTLFVNGATGGADANGTPLVTITFAGSGQFVPVNVTGSGNRISGMRFSGFDNPIAVNADALFGNDNTIDGNTFGLSAAGAVTTVVTGVAIGADGANTTVEGNTFLTNVAAGSVAVSSKGANNQVRNNTIGQTAAGTGFFETGVSLDASPGTGITGNIVKATTTGVRIAAGSNNVFFDANSVVAPGGVVLQGSDGVILSDSTIVSSSIGVDLIVSSASVLGLVVSGGTVGVRKDAAGAVTIGQGVTGPADLGGNQVGVLAPSSVGVVVNEALLGALAQGIDILGDGVTPNGTAGVVNTPILTFAEPGGVARGALSGTPGETFTVYVQGDGGGTSARVGGLLLGQGTVTLGADGTGTFEIPIAAAPPGASVRARATSATLGSSELSTTPFTLGVDAGADQSATVDTAFGVPLSLAAFDTFGEPVTDPLGPLVTLTGPATGAGLAGSPLTARVGNLQFALKANTVAGGYLVAATFDPSAAALPVAFTNLPGALAALSLTGPTALAAGQTGTFAVEAVDAFGNRRSDSGTATVSADGPGATLPAGFALAGGVGTFDAVFSKARQTLLSVAYTDTPTGTSGSDSLSIAVTGGPAVSLALTGPTALTAGRSGTYTLELFDAQGNRSSESGTATLSVDGPGATLPASVAVVNGLATFDAVLTRARATAVGATLTPASGLTLNGGVSVAVSPGPLASAALTGPAALTAGETGTFTVRLSDAFGNAVIGSTVVALSADGPGATLPATVTAVNGVATFDATFTVARPTLLTATAAGVGASLAVTVAAGPVATLRLTGPTDVSVNEAATYTVEAFDRFGNATSDPATVSLLSSLPGTVKPASVALVNGVAAFAAVFPTEGTATLAAVSSTQATATLDVGVTIPPAVVGLFPLTAAPVGLPVEFTVSFADGLGRALRRGTLVFGSSDPRATLPTPVDLTTVLDTVATFRVTFGTAGGQTLFAAVIDDGMELANDSEPVLVTRLRAADRVLLASGRFDGVVRATPLPGGAPFDGVPLPTGGRPVTVTVIDELPPVLDPTLDLGAGPRERATVVGADTAFVPVETRAISADVDGDGVADVVAFFGPGGASLVRVTLATGRVIDFGVFEDSFRGGMEAAAGDVDGDGLDDLAFSPDRGGAGRVVVLSGKGVADGTFARLADFFAIDDPAFRGGARVALGDLNGDGLADLAVGAGFGGGPRVAAFDGETLRSGSAPLKLVADIFAFESELRNGTFLAAGDVDGDGRAELVVGAGPGGGPRVLVLSLNLAGPRLGSYLPVGDFFAGDSSLRGGVRVAVKQVDDDGVGEIVTAISDPFDAGSLEEVNGQPAALPPEVSRPGVLGVFRLNGTAISSGDPFAGLGSGPTELAGVYVG